MKRLILALGLSAVFGCAHGGRHVASDQDQRTILLLEDADPVTSVHFGSDDSFATVFRLSVPDGAALAPTSASGKQETDFVGVYNNTQYTPLVDLLLLAQKSIDIEIYEMQDRDLRVSLRKALSNHVNIRIVKDPTPLGERCHLFPNPKSKPNPTDADCVDQVKLVSEITAAGGTVVAFDKQNLCGKTDGSGAKCFQHGKIAVIDSQIAAISSGNFNASNLCNRRYTHTCNRDYTYVSRDPQVIQGLQTVFNADVADQRIDIPAVLKIPNEQGTPLAAKLTVSPFSMQPLLDLIATAQGSLQIQNQYVTDESLVQAIVAAAKRGVKVELMVASACAFGPVKGARVDTLRALYDRFEAAGVNLRFFTAQMHQRGADGYLHAKAIVVDGRRAWVGSVNGSTTSLEQNREYGVFFDHPGRVNYLSATMHADQINPESENSSETLTCVHDQKSSNNQDSSEE